MSNEKKELGNIEEHSKIEKKDMTSLDDETDGAAPSFPRKTPHRPNAKTRTKKDEDFYSMEHGRRGECLIFVYKNYDLKRLESRDSADRDASLCRETFQSLGFEVQVHKDLRTKEFEQKLDEASARDHSDCDGLVVVFMSHGDSRDGTEVIHTYDGSVNTSKLWEPFVGNKCTTLAAKPKLFFIQACRGEKLDHGVGMKVMTDGPSVKKREPSYVIPAHADLLVMWASYPGMFAFNSQRAGIAGSVFIHYLAVTLKEEGTTDSHLADLLLKVTRQVALEYESDCPKYPTRDHNKQVPNTFSTLLRKIKFPAKSDDAAC